MRVVALQCLQPLRGKSHAKALILQPRYTLHRAPVGEFTPDQIAHSVSMVQEAFLKDLLVQTSAIKTSREAQFDVVDQCIVIRCGQYTIRIIALVKNKALTK